MDRQRRWIMFLDRVDAGRRLGDALSGRPNKSTVVLALPRGGVPVGAEVARVLRAPLDVILVRKLGVPAQPELAFGAIGEDGVRVLDDEIVRGKRVTAAQLAFIESRERAELLRRVARYRALRPAVLITGRDVLVVDDGIATGSTARAACQVARARGARAVAVAVPVAASGSLEALRGFADEVLALETPLVFRSVGQWYADFRPTTDPEVDVLLAQALAARLAAGQSQGMQPQFVTRGGAMHASVGERIIVRARHLGERERDGRIVETRGPDGTPPYVVRWSSDGHEALFFPQSDAIIEHEEPSR